MVETGSRTLDTHRAMRAFTASPFRHIHPARCRGMRGTDVMNGCAHRTVSRDGPAGGSCRGNWLTLSRFAREWVLFSSLH